jgi:hypothetical protein
MDKSMYSHLQTIPCSPAEKPLYHKLPPITVRCECAHFKPKDVKIACRQVRTMCRVFKHIQSHGTQSWTRWVNFCGKTMFAPCGPQSSVTTEFYVMESAQTSCIQPGFNSVRFSRHGPLKQPLLFTSGWQCAGGVVVQIATHGTLLQTTYDDFGVSIIDP